MKDRFETWSLYFILFSFIGWLYEVGVFAFELKRGFVNRGFLFGPWLPVYGCGGILILFLLKGIRDKKRVICKINTTPIVCFFAIVLISTATELITSYLMEWTMGSWLWDYTNDGPNFQGRIALKSSVRFGLIGVTILYLVPLIDMIFRKCKKETPKIFHCVTFVVIGLFAADVLARMFLGSNYIGT